MKPMSALTQNNDDEKLWVLLKMILVDPNEVSQVGALAGFDKVLSL